MAHVLVIHSSLTLRVLFEHELERLGHTVVPEDDGAARIDVALVEPTDARSLTRAEKLLNAQPGVPIIVVSPEGPTNQSRSLQPICHLEYPFSAGELQLALMMSCRT